MGGQSRGLRAAFGAVPLLQQVSPNLRSKIATKGHISNRAAEDRRVQERTDVDYRPSREVLLRRYRLRLWVLSEGIAHARTRCLLPSSPSRDSFGVTEAYDED